MNEETMNEIAKRIESYLKNDCADEWHVTLVDNYITCYYTDIKEFLLVYDNDYEDWYISGEYLYVDMIADISRILDEYAD